MIDTWTVKVLITELLKSDFLVFEADHSHVGSQVTINYLLCIHALVVIIYKYVCMYAHLILVIAVITFDTVSRHTQSANIEELFQDWRGGSVVHST